MKNIKCVIRKNLKRKDKTNLIYLRYTYNRKYILLSTDLYVEKKNWNDEKGLFKKSDDYKIKNAILAKKANELERIVLNLMFHGKEPTLLNVKAEYNKKHTQFESNEIKRKKVDEKKFLKEFQAFIDYKDDNEKVKKATIKTYITTLNKLTLFQKEESYFLDYNTITNEFYDKFLKYLRKQGLYDNSVDKHIKNIKLFMNYSLGLEKHNNNFFHTFKRTRTKADFVALDREELRKLYYKYIPDTTSHKYIRDAFILGCLTGLRFSDLKNLTSGNFNIKRDPITHEILQSASDSFINVPVQKTSEFVRIPLNQFICDLIEEYNIEKEPPVFLKRLNNQVFNREIKAIAREAGITSSVKVSKKKNSTLISKEGEKCDFISSHTMRRTFITLLSSMTQITNIQAVSGHKDIKVLTDYIKHSDAELNSVRACFNSVFDKIEDEPAKEIPTKTEKVRATIRETKIISH